jgi:3-dehydroquinate synthase
VKEIQVELGKRSYPILIGKGLLNDSSLVNKFILSKQVMIVTNETIAPLYLDQLQQTLGKREIEITVLPDGEKYKTLDSMNEIITNMLSHRFSRNSCIIALGGGVIGDIAGFASACYQRGTDFLQLPTTLLAQVDSSVGGKTAVNHRLGKNMIGAFHQPVAVITDTNVLDTLDDRQLRAGLAEVIKYGLIRDSSFFEWLEENIGKLLGQNDKALVYAIEKSCRNKADIVALDETESGIRALLNLGHTFGHAIETGLEYRDWLHGEAIATGMLMAADLSRRQGWLSYEDVERIKAILLKTGLPVTPPESISAINMRELMAVDKKAKDGHIFLVLLKSIGNAQVTDDFDDKFLKETLNSFCSGEEIV